MTEEETFGIVRYAVFPASDSDWKFVIVFLFFYSDSEADIETRRTMKEKPKISTTIWVNEKESIFIWKQEVINYLNSIDMAMDII